MKNKLILAVALLVAALSGCSLTPNEPYQVQVHNHRTVIDKKIANTKSDAALRTAKLKKEDEYGLQKPYLDFKQERIDAIIPYFTRVLGVVSGHKEETKYARKSIEVSRMCGIHDPEEPFAITADKAGVKAFANREYNAETGEYGKNFGNAKVLNEEGLRKLVELSFVPRSITRFGHINRGKVCAEDAMKYQAYDQFNRTGEIEILAFDEFLVIYEDLIVLVNYWSAKKAYDIAYKAAKEAELLVQQ